MHVSESLKESEDVDSYQGTTSVVPYDVMNFERAGSRAPHVSRSLRNLGFPAPIPLGLLLWLVPLRSQQLGERNAHAFLCKKANAFS